MARARNIKPSFFINEEMVELAFEVRLLFIGLWTLADREGRLEDKPKKIKMAIFPADNVDVNSGLDSLQKSGFIVRYKFEECQYIQILAFNKHQHPHKDEKESLIPPHDKHHASTMQAPCKHDGNPAESFNPITESFNLIPENEIAKQKTSLPSARDCEDANFEEAWTAYPARPGASKKESLKAWKSRLKAGVAPDDLLAGVHRYAAYCQAMQTEPQYVKQAVTFFGPGEHWKSDWTAQPRASPHRPFAETAEQRNARIMREVLGDDQNIIDMEMQCSQTKNLTF